MPSLRELPHELSERVLSGKASTVLSRQLNAPATSALYRHVRLRSDAAVQRLVCTLAGQPELGRLVRSLELNDRREPTSPSTRTADSWRMAVDRLTNRVYDSPDAVAALLALCSNAHTLTFRRLPREAYRSSAATAPTIELPACKTLVLHVPSHDPRSMTGHRIFELSCPGLRSLSISGFSLPCAWPLKPGSTRGLESLTVHNISWSAEALAALIRSMAGDGLRELIILDDVDAVFDGHLNVLLAAAPRLHKLHVQGTRTFSAHSKFVGLVPADCAALKELHLVHTTVSSIVNDPLPVGLEELVIDGGYVLDTFLDNLAATIDRDLRRICLSSSTRIVGSSDALDRLGVSCDRTGIALLRESACDRYVATFDPLPPKLHSCL